MTDRIKLEFVESEQYEGYGVVRFHVANIDSGIYADGMFGIQVDDISDFGPGIYNLELIKIGDI